MTIIVKFSANERKWTDACFRFWGKPMARVKCGNEVEMDTPEYERWCVNAFLVHT